MTDGSERPYQLGDGDREIAAEAKAVLDHMRATRPAKLTHGERAADKAEIAKLKADLELTKRAIVNQGNDIRQLKTDLAAVRNAVIELQRQRRPATRTTAAVQTRKRDGLDDELERGLYD